ncbi:MAG: aromatic ring-hydroxylating oxygenase subunit alpha, partial [Gemmataceae bacterium]
MVQDLLDHFDDQLPLERAHTIPASWYHDPELAGRERKHVFGRGWQLVGRGDAVARPGTFFTFDLAGEPILVVRDASGILRAFYNVCRHRAARVMVQEQGDCTRLRCRYHGWTYDLEGRLRGTPEFDGVRDFSREDHGLVSLPVSEWGPLVFVHPGPAPQQSLADWLAPLERWQFLSRMADLRFFARKEYRLACNWKVFVDNYLDGGYHVNTVHPGLAGIIDYSRYRNELAENLSVQISPLSPPGEQDGVAAVRQGDCAYYAWIFPNWMLNLYQGVMDTNLVLPDGPDACRVIFDFYFADKGAGESDAYREQSLAVAHQIQLEDVG